MKLLSCKQASFLVSQSLDRPLSWRERVSLRWHLTICDACTQFSQHLNFLRASLKRMIQRTEQDADITLSPEARVRISNSIHAHRNHD